METIIRSKNYSNIKVNVSAEASINTGIDVFDDFFSSFGGMVRPSVVLLTGSPGAGKTTLAKYLQKVLKGYKTSLYARESPESQVQAQTAGIEITHGNDYVCDQYSCPTFSEYLTELDVIKPAVVFVDSVQVIAKEDFPEMSEKDAIYEIIRAMRKWGHENSAVVFIIGHVTKEDTFKGDNTLMQMVDAHLEMIYHKKESIRTLSWGQKNRKGDVAKKLFYEFKIENKSITGFNFFTEKEFEFRGKKVKFENYLNNAVVEFLKSIDKKNVNYKKFKEEYSNRIANLSETRSGDTILEATISAARMIDELLKKYEL